ncbi:MAG: hypothetical protein FWG15_06620 [Propionibacteriaceae bacterium]|nr:hypothetical protein [Propionibacteriaceae bacterium]
MTAAEIRVRLKQEEDLLNKARQDECDTARTLSDLQDYKQAHDSEVVGPAT